MRALLAPLAVLMILLTAAPAMAQTKIAVVDFQRALNESTEGQKAKQNLEERFEKARLKLEAERATVQQMQEDLEGQKVMLSSEALIEKENALQQKMLEFQQLVLENQQEMAMLEQEMTGSILEKLYKIAQGVAAEDGFNLVIEASAVVYNNGTMDLTPKVISRYNAP
jgi:outer membrane protein